MLKINKADEMKLDAITNAHKVFFYSIGSKIYKDDVNVAYFINSLLGDYIFDINTYVRENLEDELKTYWEGKIDLYCEQLINEMNHARYGIINIFLLFYDRPDLLTATQDEIEDSTLDVYGGTGPDDLFTTKPDIKRIKKLSDNQLNVLNKYLEENNFKKIENIENQY